jgi:uncharacterized protein
MHLTLHLTTGCNMSCEYCYSPPGKKNDMDYKTGIDSIDYISKHFPINTGIIFFGGEPLLKKDLIVKLVRYAKKKEAEKGCIFHYKVTTNGVLLDEEFIKFSNSVGLQISISLDGVKKAHDHYRKLQNGMPTWDLLQDKIEMLLKYQPYSKVLLTVSPQTVEYYSDSVEYLIDKGFRYVVASIDYSGAWTDKALKELGKQYKLIAKIYEKKTINEEKFYFSPFDMKLASYIKKDDASIHQCHLGKRQIAISFDGNIYPCVQFVQDGLSNKDYIIGDIYKGINSAKQEELYTLSKVEEPECASCDYNDRCNNKCSCLNWQLTKTVNKISPIICETERQIIPIVDKLGEKLFRLGAPMFIQKHYNAVYPIISMIEDTHQ